MHYFDKIYKAALQCDTKTLQTVTQKGGVIDEFKDAITPAALLASQGMFKAAELLIWFGANVDDIRMYAARAGKLSFCNYLMQQYHCSGSGIAIGAIASGHFEYAENLYENNKANLLNLYCGAAMGEQREVMQYLFDKYTNPFTDEMADISDFYGHMIRGSILGKKKSYQVELQTSFQKTALEMGQFQIEMLPLQAFISPEDFKNNFKKYSVEQQQIIAKSSAMGGYFDYADMLIYGQENIDGLTAKSRRDFAIDLSIISAGNGCFIYAIKVAKLFEIDEDIPVQAAVSNGFLNIIERSSKPSSFSLSDESVKLLRDRYSNPGALEYSLALILAPDVRALFIRQLNAKQVFNFVYSDNNLFISIQKNYLLSESTIRLLQDDGIRTFLILHHHSNAKTNAKNLPMSLISYILTFLTNSYRDDEFIDKKMDINCHYTLESQQHFFKQIKRLPVIEENPSTAVHDRAYIDIAPNNVPEQL